MTHDPATSAADTAAWLVARMDSGRWGEIDEAELEAWLAEDPARKGLLLQTQSAWLMLDQAGKKSAMPYETEYGEGANEADSHWRRRSVIGGLAAAVTAAVTAAIFGSATWYNRGTSYATNLGEIRRVPLADGSVMAINSATEVRVQMAGRAREIELSKGEAWFQVAKDPSRPFVVAAGRVKARAVGTAFSVRMHEAAVEVLVNEGIVETWSDENESLRLRIAAGERIMISDRAIVHYEATKSSSVDRALAWRGGLIDLNGTELSEAADEFNRYNQRLIVIADPKLAVEKFDGLFSVNDPEGFAEAVKITLGARVNNDDPRYIRIERAAESEKQ